MALSLTCRSVVKQSGKIYVRWSDKVEQEFDSVADVRRWLADLRDGDGDCRDLLRAMLIRWVLQRDSDGTTLASLITGRTVTFDPSLASNIVKVT